MRVLFAALLLIAFAAVPTAPAEAGCRSASQKDSRGHHCGSRSKSSKYYHHHKTRRR